MLRPRLKPDRRIWRADFSAHLALLAAFFTLLTWSIPIGFHHGSGIDFPKASHEQ